MLKESFCICLLRAVSAGDFFITSSVNLITNGVVMEALLGIDHLSLKTACLGKNIAAC